MLSGILGESTTANARPARVRTPVTVIGRVSSACRCLNMRESTCGHVRAPRMYRAPKCPKLATAACAALGAISAHARLPSAEAATG